DTGGFPSLDNLRVRMAKSRMAADGDNGVLWVDSGDKFASRGGMTPVVRHFYYIGFEDATTIYKFVFRIAFDIARQKKSAAAVNNAKDDRVVVVRRCVDRLVQTGIKNFNSCSSEPKCLASINVCGLNAAAFQNRG